MSVPVDLMAALSGAVPAATSLQSTGNRLGAALFGGGAATRQALFDQGAEQGARTSTLLEQARKAREQQVAMQAVRGGDVSPITLAMAGLNPEQIGAAQLTQRQLGGLNDAQAAFQGLGYTPQQATLVSALLNANKGANPDNVIQGFDRAAIPVAGTAAAPQLKDAFLNALGQKTTDVSGGVAFDPFGDASQAVNVTPVGAADIAQKNASAASSYASAAKSRAETGGGDVVGGGKAADWVIQQDAGGGLYRVNKRTGEAMPVTVNGQPVLGKQAINAQQAVNAAQGSAESFKTALDTLGDLQNDPGLEKSVGLRSMLPTIPGSDAANFESNLETFKAQTFLPMVQNLRGLGQLSDAEGSKLTAAVGRLNVRQSPEQFKANLNTIRNTLTAAQKRANANASRISQVTATPATAVVADPATAAAPAAAPPADAGWSIQRVD